MNYLLFLIFCILLLVLLVSNDRQDFLYDISYLSQPIDNAFIVQPAYSLKAPDFEIPDLKDIKRLSDPALYINEKNASGDDDIIQTLSSNIQVSRLKQGGDPMEVFKHKQIDAPTLLRLMRGVQYTAAAYCSDLALEKWECYPNCQGYTGGSKFLLSFQSVETDTSGFFVVQASKKAIVLVFRGSRSIKNWFNNFKFFKRSLDWEQTPPGVSVHRGFYITYMVIRQFIHSELKLLIEEYPGYTIDVFGHSLGGAIATLAALDIKAVLLPKVAPLGNVTVNLITHGQPRLGNHAFTKYFSKRFYEGNDGDAYRVVTYADIVPHVPPSGLGFEHCTQEIWLTKSLLNDYIKETVYCSEGNFEDPNCSNSIKAHELSVEDHSLAWNITIALCY